MLKFEMPLLICEDTYSQSMANCCTKLNEHLCGITYRARRKGSDGSLFWYTSWYKNKV